MAGSRSTIQHLNLAVVVLRIDLLRDLLRHLSSPTEDLKLHLLVLAIPDRVTPAECHDDSNSSDVWRDRILHFERYLATAMSASTVVGVSLMIFSSTISVVIPSASPSKFRITRCRIAGTATSLMSWKLTWNRPSNSARTFAPSVIACAARGLAPTLRN